MNKEGLKAIGLAVATTWPGISVCLPGLCCVENSAGQAGYQQVYLSRPGRQFRVPRWGSPV